MSRAEPSIAFLHPDLGLGGAERLVVDAAAELKRQGAEVEVFTAFHDPSRSFQETTDGTFPVIVCGGWFPRTIFNKAYALCAYIRCILVALYIAWKAFRRKRQYDIIIADQVSAVIPFIHIFTSSKVLFYCHHPDLLLAVRRPGLHSLYRRPLDWAEQATTGQADQVLVNSAYTAEIFESTFRTLHLRGIRPGVLHPACAIPTGEDLRNAQANWRQLLPERIVASLGSSALFLSINRFERKKSIELAIKAFRLVAKHEEMKQDTVVTACKLVIAGGYDPRLAENREYLQELEALADELGLSEQVLFLPSFTDQQRAALLAACTALLYTPSNEHFGIVPLEAMAAGRPVIACNNGGPVESVIHNETGFLCEPQPQNFAAAMQLLLDDAEMLQLFGGNARKHVVQAFSRPAFGRKLWSIISDMLS